MSTTMQFIVTINEVPRQLEAADLDNQNLLHNLLLLGVATHNVKRITAVPLQDEYTTYVVLVDAPKDLSEAAERLPSAEAQAAHEQVIIDQIGDDNGFKIVHP